MTEHYWLANPNDIREFVHHKALTEFFPKDVLVWQNNIPDEGKSHSVSYTHLHHQLGNGTT